MGNSSGLTFRQTELLQLTGQRLTVNIMLCCTGENEAEHCHTRFDIPALCKMDGCHECMLYNKKCNASMTVL